MLKKEIKNESEKSIENKRENEKKIVGLMIKIYCKGHKHAKDGICEECRELLNYSNKMIELCPFMKTKTFCQNCKIHCYKEDMRIKIKKVMRYSGPRMMFYHPLLTINHVIENYKEKKRRKRNQNSI